ncbi:MAG: nucleotidyltransferase domain-containing protein [Candidatus Delongbacteria bacterium]|nr:nucleotidyltransferase domain-containing protein [Candidatus Delongbacteria bacterium]
MSRDKIIAFLKLYKKLNQNKYHIKKMGIFGSIARNEFSNDSDIDIVVELSKQDLFNLIGIKQDLENEFNKHVDIISYRENMNSFLKNRINNEAIYV